MSRRWMVPALALAWIAGWIAVDLSVLHYRLLFGEAAGGACGPEGGCAEVVGSRYGEWIGVPVSVWGLWHAIVAAALGLAALVAPAAAAAHVRALAWLAVLALIADAALATVAWSRLGRFCPLCTASYATHAGLLACAALAMRRAGVSWFGALPAVLPPVRAPGETVARGVTVAASLPGVALVLCGLGLVAALALSSSAREMERENRAGLLEHLRTAEPVALPAEGRPSRGAPRGRVRLVVFSDFLCGQCALLDRHLDIVLAGHRDALTIEYRHFPMDAACNPIRASRSPHPGACELARAAECAARQGRFWEFHAAAHERGATPSPARIEEYASRAGLDLARFRACRADSTSLAAVLRDVALADSLDVSSTPTTFVGGRAVVGAFKPWLWEEMIETVTRAERGR